MGVKRPFDGDEMEDLSFSHAKQPDHKNKLTFFTDDFSSQRASDRAAMSGEADGNFNKDQYDEEGLEKSSPGAIGERELEISGPLSWVTSSGSEEETGSGETFYSSFLPDYFEYNFPRRPVVQFEDFNASLVEYLPRKEVPVGPNYQADIPLWDPNSYKKDSSTSQMLGICVIPMPESNTMDSDNIEIGCGRTDCSCLDRGSIRCVRQHVNDARQKLRSALGDENFAELGFYDMGEGVALNWTEEEERIFHEVIYTNASLGKNFWKHLEVEFPSRTKKEIVSYYFNVFMLQKRAVQNRSQYLEIDSDDDERHQDDGDLKRIGDDDDSIVEFEDQEEQIGHEEDYSYENGHDDEDDDEDDNNDDDDDDNDDGANGGARGEIDANVKDDGPDEYEFIQGNSKDKTARNLGGDFDIQEDSSTSTETQPSSVGLGIAIQVSTPSDDNKRCFHGSFNSSHETLISGFLMEHCESKVWDSSYSTGLVKSVDLLPTCSMIEEIFGTSSWKNDETAS